MNDLRFREDEHAIRPAKSFRLDRSDGKLMGVCAGIANYLGVDALWVRIAFVAGALLGFGSFILIYLAIALIAD